jgi:hypothetical protein
MSLPNAEGAIVDAAKIRDYLLSTAHPVGRFKAAFFVSLGYSADRWEVLRDDILALARTGVAAPGEPSPYGRKFELDGILTGPSGRSAAVGTVWVLRTGEQFPRFVTAFPR